MNVMPSTETKHGWFFVQFNYGGWTECECGFRPVDETEYLEHGAANV